MNHDDVLSMALDLCTSGRFVEAEAKFWLASRLAKEEENLVASSWALIRGGLAFETAKQNATSAEFYAEAEKLLADTPHHDLHASTAFALAKSLENADKIAAAIDAYATAAISYQLSADIRRKANKLELCVDDLQMAVLCWRMRFLLSS